jgi:RNA recognition motif-containing protein
MYRGKRRCPTCGVPSLICRSCFEADKEGTKKLDKYIRCDLCVAEDVKSKRALREKEEKEAEEYERKLRQRQQSDDGHNQHAEKPFRGVDESPDAIANRSPCPNPEGITRIFLKNMCAKRMDESTLLDFLHPAKVTHIQWLTDRNTGKFYGSAFIETATPDDAGLVLARDGGVVLGRKIRVKYQKADEKDLWPIPNTKVSSGKHF